jgi:hypothetical protein
MSDLEGLWRTAAVALYGARTGRVEWTEALGLYSEAVTAEAQRPKRYWHAYQAQLPELLEDSLGPVVAFTVVADTSSSAEEAPQTHLGTVLAYELVFRYVTSWDHEPTGAEREEAQMAEFQRARKGD